MTDSHIQIASADIDSAPPKVQEWFIRHILRTTAKAIPHLLVLGSPGKSWEYFCRNCGQLRFSAKPERPVACGNCMAGAEALTIGRPGTVEKVNP